MTPEERELRKERRKSMPLQPTQQQTEVVPTPSLKYEVYKKKFV
jgi:hypothetical protein